MTIQEKGGAIALAAGLALLTLAGSAWANPKAGATSREQKIVDLATAAAKEMLADKNLQKSGLVKNAEALLIVPVIDRATEQVGGKGGAAVLIQREHDKWSHPAFYDIGPIAAGTEGGGTGGAMVLLLMTGRAVSRFANNQDFWLSTHNDMRIERFPNELPMGTPDVVIWTQKPGAFPGLLKSGTTVTQDTGEDHAYYGKPVQASDILVDRAHNSDADVLRRVLPTS